MFFSIVQSTHLVFSNLRRLNFKENKHFPNSETIYFTQAGIKIAGRNINNLRYADDNTLMAESNEELKNLLMKVKEESEKVDIKLNSQN